MIHYTNSSFEWAANDPVLQRQVAIKLQTRQLDDSSFEKMLQEARAAAKLRHPNIVAVFEVAADDQRPFVVPGKYENIRVRNDSVSEK